MCKSGIFWDDDGDVDGCVVADPGSELVLWKVQMVVVMMMINLLNLLHPAFLFLLPISISPG